MKNKLLNRYITTDKVYPEKLDCVCPECNSSNTVKIDGYGTCMGGNPDPNYYDNRCKCSDCELEFYFCHTYSRGETYVWYIVGGFVTKGIAERGGKYKCVCGGIIRQEICL